MRGDPHAIVVTHGLDAGRLMSPSPGLRTFVRLVAKQPQHNPMLTVSGPRARRIVHLHDFVRIQYERQDRGVNDATVVAGVAFGFLIERPLQRPIDPGIRVGRLEVGPPVEIVATDAGIRWATGRWTS